MKLELVLLIILIIIAIILITTLYSNFSDGKIFTKCSKCGENKIYHFDVPELPKGQIDSLYDLFKKKTNKLDPKKNFNQAKGKKLDFNELPSEILNFYTNKFYEKKVSELVGENVTYAPFDEKYRIFSRVYDNENDFLDWHYDNNYSNGNRYTLVIPILIDKGNTSEFYVKDRKTEEEKKIDIPIGSAVLYNGSEVYHKITRQKKGMRRMVIIIPFYGNNNKSIIGNFRTFCRNITYKVLSL